MSVPKKETSEHLSHWYHLFEGLIHSPSEFYRVLEDRISKRELPDVRMGRITFNEKGLLSGRREYLRVVRGELAFDICGAPFGNSAFFISYWLGSIQMNGCLVGLLASLPIAGALFERGLRPMTYFQKDSALMFQDTIHNIILGHVDELSSQEGITPISDESRKPTIKQLSGL